MSDLKRWVESRVIHTVEAEEYDLFSIHALVMFDEKQWFSESGQNWQLRLKSWAKVSFTKIVEP